MLVHRFLENSAGERPESVALIETDGETRYGDLNLRANRYANALLGSGLQYGDRVVIALDNCAEMVAAYFGIMKAGGAAVPLPAPRRNDRLSKAVADCSPRICLVDAAAAAGLEALSSMSTVLTIGDRRSAMPGPAGIEPLLAAAGDASPHARPVDSDLALIVYTSGSTGEPRGVMLTHRNVVSNTQSILQYLHLTRTDRVMCVLPFHYVYGLSLLHTHVAAGGAVVIHNRFAFPNVVLDAMRTHRVTGLAGVPSTFTFLLHRSNLEATELPDLKYVTQAGGAMPANRLAEWLQKGPKVPFYVMYGATEAAARLTYLDPAELPRRPGSIGRAIPGVEILVLREDGTPADVGEVGELVARGENIAVGYWNDPEGTRARFDELGYHTGDLGYADADGFLYLVGRRHDMIKVGAHRVGPKEIEDVICDHPAIREAAVIGAPHDLLGEAPVAFVSLRGETEFDRDALMIFLRDRLPPHKMPVRVFVLAELPKTSGVGKIDKVSLRAQLESELGASAL